MQILANIVPAMTGRFLLTFFLVIGTVATGTLGQDVSSDPIADLQKRYDDLVDQWRKSMKQVTEAGIRFSLSTQEESTEFRKKWYQEVAKAELILGQLRPVALQLFDGSPKPSEELTKFLAELAHDFYALGLYDDAMRIANRILESEPENQGMIYVRGRCSIFMNEFDIAKEFVTKHSVMLKELPDEEKRYFNAVDQLQEGWEKELAIREKEAADDDLPRVEIKTTKGTIVVELFENEAPGTVGNFIKLVEDKHYEGLVFHRTINHFMAQTGGYDEQANRRHIGYTIYDEFGKPEARRHFRGVLSMALGRDPNSGSSEFFIATVPTFFLDGRHTVFGRVIEGWSALDRITRTFKSGSEGEEPIAGAVPDKILSARVIRKRDHEYAPDKFEIPD